MEEWRDIEGYDGKYRVSSRGRVMSMVGRPKIRKPGLRGGSSCKYPSVILCGPNGKKNHMVHDLVAAAFIGPKPDGMQTCHNDGNPENNCPENLRYDTPAGNQADRRKHGTEYKGSRHHFSSFKIDEVREVRRSKDSAKALARRFGVSPSAIDHIRSRRNYAWVSD